MFAPEGITEDSNLLPSLMLMNVSEVLSPPDSEPLHVCPDRLPIVYRQSVVVVAPFHALPTCDCKCNRGTKRAKGLFLNNNALLFPWTTAQMSMKSRLPGRHFGTWWSRRQEWRSHRAELFNTCQHANAVSTIRIKVYRVLHIKHTRRGATITLNEQHNRDNGFFYHSESCNVLKYETRFSLHLCRSGTTGPAQQNNSHVAWKRSPNNCCRKTLERKIFTFETVSCLRGVCGVPPCYLWGPFFFLFHPHWLLVLMT